MQKKTTHRVVFHVLARPEGLTRAIHGTRGCAPPSASKSAILPICRTRLIDYVGGSMVGFSNAKKNLHLAGFCMMARPEGFEPPTTWFVACQSMA